MALHKETNPRNLELLLLGPRSCSLFSGILHNAIGKSLRYLQTVLYTVFLQTAYVLGRQLPAALFLAKLLDRIFGVFSCVASAFFHLVVDQV
jgi:hypothetical protein